MASGGVEEACLAQCDEAPVRCVATAQLDLVGLGIRAPHGDADAILRGHKPAAQLLSGPLAGGIIDRLSA